MSLRAIYGPRRLRNAAPLDQWYDGVESALYKDTSGNPAFSIFAGWNEGGVSGGSASWNRHFITSDKFVTVTAMPNPPYSGRHNNGVAYNDALDEITIWHGDGTLDPHAIPQDVWGWHYVTGWHQHTASTGMGSRQGCTHGWDEKYFYMINGYQLWNEGVNNVTRCLKSDPSTWEVLWSTVGTPLENISNGWLCFHHGKLYLGGGGWRKSPTPNIINTKIWCSKDHMETMPTLVYDGPLMDSGIWSRCKSVGGPNGGDVAIYRSGSDSQNATHRKRLLMTEDFTKFVKLPTYIPGATDAMALVTDTNGDVYTGMGYQHNEFWQIPRKTNMFI
jgi:hypothetical protein